LVCSAVRSVEQARGFVRLAILALYRLAQSFTLITSALPWSRNMFAARMTGGKMTSIAVATVTG
jgi:hypothetical protein